MNDSSILRKRTGLSAGDVGLDLGKGRGVLALGASRLNLFIVAGGQKGYHPSTRFKMVQQAGIRHGHETRCVRCDLLEPGIGGDQSWAP